MTAYASLEEALAAPRAEVRTLTVDVNRTGVAWETWPDELWTLSELEVLRLDQGRLFTVPSRIRELSKLRVLELRGGFQWFEPGLGELAQLRELAISGKRLEIPPGHLANLRLDRLSLRGRWDASVEAVARIPVRVNVTLLDGHPEAASWLEQQDLSAWRELEELEIDAFEDFAPAIFERKLRRCGFAINRKRRVDWTL